MTGALGYYLGIGKGAEVIGDMATNARISEELGTIGLSVKELNRNDLAYSSRIRRTELQTALMELALVYPNASYWACSDHDRIAIKSAAEYLAAHPDILQDTTPGLDEPKRPAIRRALTFCQDQSVYRRN